MTAIKRTRFIASAAALLLLVTVLAGLYFGTQTRRQFVEIAESWSDYAGDAEKKGAWISSIRGHLGYGGIIHNFKNYVLRKDDRYRQELQKQLTQFDAVMASYLAEPLPAAERRALLAIDAMIGQYRQKIAIAERAAMAGWPVERTDPLVRVDDTDAILALSELERMWQQSRDRATGRIIAAVARGGVLIALGYVAMVMLVVAVGAIAVLIGLLVSDLRDAARKASDQLAARLVLARSEQRLAQAVEESPATIIVTDARGRIQYVNRRFETASGWMRQEVLGRTPKFLQSGDTPVAEYARMRAVLASGETWSGMLRNRRKDGGSYWVDITVLALKDETGAIHSLVAIGEDITEKRIAREQVVRAQKIEAVGLMAAGLAHDFNNILTVIIGSVYLAALDAPPGSVLAEEIEQIDIAARRARTLVRQLLGFAHRQPGRPVATDLCAVTREVERLIRASVPPTIRIEGAKDCGPVHVLADPTHLLQILMNLCTNAAEAIGDGDGTITIRSRLLDGQPEGLASRADGWVELDVGDTGAGMTAEIRDRIFDAFFTTKPLGKGTGLGLSVVLGLVQDIGGRVTVTSAAGKGTRFSILLPATPPLIEASQPVGADLPARGNETILLVDDQTEVAATLRRGLMHLGYQVEAFTSPFVALERFARNPGRHRLLVCDVVMPDMNGVDMAGRMRKLRPDLPVILCTGYNPAGLRLEGGATRVMEKPIDPIELGRIVRELLDRCVSA